MGNAHKIESQKIGKINYFSVPYSMGGLLTVVK
jgi:hypothetical protein